MTQPLCRDRSGRAKVESDQQLPTTVQERLPLAAYKKYEGRVERGFELAAKFLLQQHIYRIFDLPYQSQVVALAAILADIGEATSFSTASAATSLPSASNRLPTSTCLPSAVT